jgi:hypothetical protein
MAEVKLRRCPLCAQFYYALSCLIAQASTQVRDSLLQAHPTAQQLFSRLVVNLLAVWLPEGCLEIFGNRAFWKILSKDGQNLVPTVRCGSCPEPLATNRRVGERQCMEASSISNINIPYYGQMLQSSIMQER